MYIQITTRCNMACGHCCFACRPGVGNDMDPYVFQQALEVARDHGDYIALGGGEPTLHPRFWDFFKRARIYHEAAGSGIAMLVVTNGARTRDALKLARLCHEDIDNAETPTFNAVLSQDYWHDPIDPKVVRAFKELKARGREGIRTNTQITKHGSAIVNQCHTNEDWCCCHDTLVHPSGRYYGCGCRKYSLGTVFSFNIPDGYQPGECMVQWRREQAAAGAV